MRSMHLVMLAFALSFPLPSAAQSGAAQDTTQPAPKKKGGLFGKVKGLAKNKVVQQVAKTAACNMVPGGQLVAGAIDNASAKKAAKNAATNAAKDAVAGAALGAATGKSTCGPGLMGGLGSAGLAKGVAGVGIPGMPTTGMPGVGGSADQMKQMAEQYQKMGMDPAQIKAMQQMMAGMNPAAAAGSVVAAPSAAVTPSAEAVPAPTLKKEKNRLELRRLPWLPRSEAIQPGAEATFAGGIQSLATQLQPGTRQYKIEVKVEDQGSKEQSQLLAQKRAAVVVSFLVAQGLSESRLVIGDGAADKDARVVISESKSGK